MGLLKHFVLPLYVLFDLAVVFQLLVAEDLVDMMTAWGDPATSATQLEMHLAHAVGGAVLVLLLNNIAAIIIENSHYRGMAVFLQVVFFSADAFSYVRMGKEIPAVLYGIVGLGLAGLAVHANEPGIFTKDKGGKAKSG